MDSLLLFIVSKLLKYSATYFRLFAAATIGGIWACVETIIPIDNIVIKTICTYIIISCLMIRICAGKRNLKEMIKGVVTLYIAACIVGGLGHMLYYYTKAGYYINTVILNDSLLMITIFMAVVLMLAISKYINKFIVYDSKICRIMLKIGENQVVINGMIDTGNVLNDPIYHKPVNIAEYQVIESIFHNIEDCTKVKYHMIPFSSLGCAQGCIEVIMVDVMYIYRNNKAVILRDVLVGMYKEKLSSDDAYQMILNSEIFR